MKITYSLNEDYFATIDTEAKAYWLGFVAADGCLPPLKGGSSPRRMTIRLAACDTAHLEKLREAIEYTGPLYFNNVKPGKRVESYCRDMPAEGYPSVALSIGRKRFVTHLVNQGIRPKKSGTLEPPNGSVPNELLRHYWRGILDGDGSIGKSVRARGGVEWSVGIVGTQAICEGFRQFISERSGVSVSAPYRRLNLWYVSVSGTQVPQIAIRTLYSDATVFLQRKKDRADELMAMKPGKLMRTVVNGMAIRVSECATRIGVTRVTISRRLAAGISPELATTLNKLPPRCGFGEKYSHDGKSLPISEWASLLGIKAHVIRHRLARGDTIERALRPARAYTRRK